MVQETGNQGLAESSIEEICVDHLTLYTSPRCTGPLVRHMLGAGRELVAAEARERLSHGRQRAGARITKLPSGVGRWHYLKHDPELVSARKVYAKLRNFANTQG